MLESLSSSNRQVMNGYQVYQPPWHFILLSLLWVFLLAIGLSKKNLDFWIIFKQRSSLGQIISSQIYWLLKLNAGVYAKAIHVVAQHDFLKHVDTSFQMNQILLYSWKFHVKYSYIPKMSTLQTWLTNKGFHREY